jgi:hypothetical protein
MKLRLFCLALVVAVSATHLLAQTSSGPRKGSLVLVGGDFKIGLDRFVRLAGGPDANFIYIPTAASSIKLPSGFIYDPPQSDTPAANTAEFEQPTSFTVGQVDAIPIIGLSTNSILSA